jgi:hypothetical protein
MKYSLIFPGSQVLCCVVVAGFGETIKRNRRLRGKGSAPLIKNKAPARR